MFENAQPRPIDQIIAVTRAYAEDPRTDKVDFGIGVYKDEMGNTPVMRAVKEAERRLVEGQKTKTYVGVGGDQKFVDLLSGAVLPGYGYGTDMIGVQAIGGSGAVRLLAELARTLNPDARFWLPEPTWPNHGAILGAVGATMESYPYPKYKAEVDVDAILSALDAANPGDVVILHGSCHNPTGIDPEPEALARLVDGIVERELMPFVDAAYVGFGHGWADDAARISLIAERAPEMLLALSCSKNFGIYRERTGAALLVSKGNPQLAVANSQLLAIARQSYSMPPDHGASIVRTIFEDDALKADWLAELEEIRNRIRVNRSALALALARAKQDRDWTYIDKGFGMFSLLDVTPEDAKTLREDQGVYVIPDGRMNIAGIDTSKVDEIAAKLVSVL
ncbi:aromatic amino acid transaminase [Parasphingopyxis marina]|uniref:Aspartate/tyrosine/aromatic aminotransferase n=1 Tax=Parasphingopyxis marina TaxID=2761622 RepID=A0A842HY05_9SPHN|nr:aromatic amino acid transaminase [Parasphingopyxis marina]MBC2779068.1 aspartate/tyrosine/aromatic aminotransferase [Parasphingopyxis marina]